MATTASVHHWSQPSNAHHHHQDQTHSTHFDSLFTHTARSSEHHRSAAVQSGIPGQISSDNNPGWSKNIWSNHSSTRQFGALSQKHPHRSSLQTITGTQFGFAKPNATATQNDRDESAVTTNFSGGLDPWIHEQQPWSSADLRPSKSVYPVPPTSVNAQSRSFNQAVLYPSSDKWPPLGKSRSVGNDKLVTNMSYNEEESFTNEPAITRSVPIDTTGLSSSENNWYARKMLNHDSVAISTSVKAIPGETPRISDGNHAAKLIQQRLGPTTPDFIKNHHHLLDPARTQNSFNQEHANAYPNAHPVMNQVSNMFDPWSNMVDGGEDTGPWNKHPYPSIKRGSHEAFAATQQPEWLGHDNLHMEWTLENNYKPLIPRSQPWSNTSAPEYLLSQNVNTSSYRNDAAGHYTYEPYPKVISEGEELFHNPTCTRQKVNTWRPVDIRPKGSNNPVSSARKLYTSNHTTARQEHFHTPQGFPTNQFPDHTGPIQRRDQSSWVPDNMLQTQVRNRFMSHLEYSFRELALNGYPSYGMAPHLMPQPRFSTNGFHQEHDSDHAVRSRLLEEFREIMNPKANQGRQGHQGYQGQQSTRKFELKDIYNHIVEFAGDQHGSRYIQTKLETANSEEKERVFRELVRDAVPLMKDVFGNYVIQKMFEHGDQNQKKILVNKMKGQVYELTIQIYGCRVVQKALQHVLVDQQISIISELERHVLKCVRDQHGNHVIQRIIELVPFEYINFVVDAFVGQAHHLATHPYGCRVVQRLLEKSRQPSKSTILRELHTYASALITDQYGNYVIQNVVEQGNAEDRGRILAVVRSNLIPFSRQKYASNVVEKCLVHGTDEQRRAIMHALTAKDSDGENSLPLLVRDQYGNYVIQKLLEVLDPVDRAGFNQALEPEVSSACRASVNYKQANNVAKQMHAFGPVLSHDGNGRPALSTLETTSSTVSTPPLTADSSRSPLSSSVPSTFGESAMSQEDRDAAYGNHGQNDMPRIL